MDAHLASYDTLAFGYDASGNVTSYTYDDLNRIVTEADADNTITYTYDGRGNRTKRTVTGLDAGTTVYNLE